MITKCGDCHYFQQSKTAAVYGEYLLILSSWLPKNEYQPVRIDDECSLGKQNEEKP